MPSGSELPEVRPVFHLATDYFQGTFFVLRLRFPSKTSCDSHHIPFYTLSFNYLKNAQPLFSCRPYDSRPKLSLRLRLSGSHPVDLAFDGLFFRIPVWSPCGFLSEILRSVTFRILCGGACFKSGNNQSFNQKTPGVLSCSFELTLARNDFLRKLSGTYEPSNLRLSATTLKRTLSTFLVARIALDCSLLS
jgi:hypothetical protein